MIYDLLFFFVNDTATTEIYTLSLHDALPICRPARDLGYRNPGGPDDAGERGRLHRLRHRHRRVRTAADRPGARSEEHTSELQSRQYLVCRLLLEKKADTVIIVRLSQSTLSRV